LLTIATWNIISVRLRLRLIEKLLSERHIDVLCLQETKVADEKFPHDPLQKMGFTHRAICGAKGYHGVATLSRIKTSDHDKVELCPEDGPRHVSAVLPGGAFVHNYYVPAGGDEPDPKINPKFDHKLRYLDGMATYYQSGPGAKQKDAILVGDLNIAPGAYDVWSHKQLLKIVSHTPVETEGLEKIRATRDFVDIARKFNPDPEKLYTWWSYRSKDWQASNKGRRLDHIWVTPSLADKVQSVEILEEARGWERPSDHVPMLMTIDI
jgi:exodeoxyribonuclease-3